MFCEVTEERKECPELSPPELADAVVRIVDAGARIVNLSLGMDSSTLSGEPLLASAFDYARKRGVLIVAASGNSGRVGRVPLFATPGSSLWGPATGPGRLVESSNIGPAVGRQGLLAPGSNVSSTDSGGGYSQMSGTSVAAPFVTGAAGAGVVHESTTSGGTHPPRPAAHRPQAHHGDSSST